MIRTAVIPNKFYRYSLTRGWNLTRETPKVCFVMLNPSIADADVDDRTVVRCIGFAVGWMCASLEVVNLFGYRATYPSDLFQPKDPVGPENDAYIVAALRRADIVVAAWGAGGGSLLPPRVREVKRLLRESGKAIQCLGVTHDGQPRHPLMLPKLTPLIPFSS